MRVILGILDPENNKYTDDVLGVNRGSTWAPAAPIGCAKVIQVPFVLHLHVPLWARVGATNACGCAPLFARLSLRLASLHGLPTYRRGSTSQCPDSGPPRARSTECVPSRKVSLVVCSSFRCNLVLVLSDVYSEPPAFAGTEALHIWTILSDPI